MSRLVDGNPETERESSMSLNFNQRFLLGLGVVLFVLMGLIPPWIYTFAYSGATTHIEKPAGYFLIIDPPKPETNRYTEGVRIDFSRLLLQWIIVAAATGLSIFLARGPEEGHKSQP